MLKDSFGQDFERYKPKLAPPAPHLPTLPTQEQKPASGSDDVLVPRLDAILVVDSTEKIDAKNPLPDAVDVKYDFANAHSLIYSPEAQAILHQNIGQPITLRRLNEIARAIILLYRKCGLPIIDVLIPEQNITSGTVQLVVIESRIGHIQFLGACLTDECYLRNLIRCSQPGDLVRDSVLREDLYWLNRNPFRKVGVDFKPGQQDGTTDILFDVREVRAVRGYVGYEDTGVRSLALERLIAGFMIGNLFGSDGTLGYQYTADPKFTQLEAHAVSFNYEPTREWGLSSYGSWAAAQPDLPPPPKNDFPNSPNCDGCKSREIAPVGNDYMQSSRLNCRVGVRNIVRFNPNNPCQDRSLLASSARRLIFVIKMPTQVRYKLARAG